jgi:TonB-linked SusC/RagA family outer membrane protein
MRNSKWKCIAVLAMTFSVCNVFVAMPKISLSLRNVTLKQFIEAIEEQTEYTFMLDNTVDLAQHITVNSDQEELETVLTKALNTNTIKYEIVGKQIVLNVASKKTVPKVMQGDNIKKLTGVVLDENGEPLLGANVLQKGTTNGSITDLDGKFTIDVPQGSTLVITYIGYITKEVSVGNATTFRINLVEDSKALDEVVVVGYGVVKKSDLTSSISTVKGEEITSLSTGNALYSLQGKATGVQITADGSPDGTPRVIIRGVTSINGSDPLYVVDGVPTGTSISDLNQDDIESIEVLKDASSAAIYGTRGSNGVILITTKQGRMGKTTFQFNASVGVQSMPKPDVAGPEVYEQVYKARYINDGNVPVWKANPSGVTGTDWWDEVINDYAPMQNYTLSFQGGSDRFVYSGSVGYFRQKSQYDVGFRERITGQFKNEYRFSKVLKAGVDFSPRMGNSEAITSSTIEYTSSGIFASAMKMDPTTPVYRPESEWTSSEFNNFARSNNNLEYNPASSIARSKGGNKTQEYGLRMNPYISIEPIKGLVVRSQFSVNARFRIHDTFNPQFFIDNLEKLDLNQAQREANSSVDWNWTNTANYIVTIYKKHNLNLMAGYTLEKFADYQLTGSRQAIPSNHPDLRYVAAGTLNQQATGTNVYNTLMSYLGRVMYNYDNRYYITASVRRDGSSKFPAGNKYATFPAVSLAYRISEEGFMKDQFIISNLKLRLGWGRVGNQNIDPNAYVSLLTAADYVYGVGANRFVGTALSTVGNTTLRWEVVEDYNIGLDMAFLQGKLSVTADYFRKLSKDMLMQKENMSLLGYPTTNGRMWTNIGSMEAKGWELGVNWNDKVRGLKYELGLNLTSVKNMAKKFVGDAPIFNGTFWNFNDYAIRNVAGEEISRFFGLVSDGIFQNQSEIDSYTGPGGNKLQPLAVPGDMRFKNLNGDDVIDAEDRTYIGSAFPDLMIGFNTRFAYRNFDLVANFYGTIGNDIFNAMKGDFYSGANGQNVFADAYEKAWKGEGTSTTFPRLSVLDANMNYRRISSFFVEDGSYFRCKLLQLGYTIPKQLVANLGLRVSVSVQNPFTITKYSGMDPERAAMGNALESGIDRIGYPNPYIYLFGVNLTF